MLVRLAFAVMMEADADVLLIDEVLAVGDAAFQQKCADAFHQMKAEGKTIVLVTHEMATVEDYCHRAMLIADGEIQHIGDPGEVGREYLRLNFEGGADEGAATEGEEVRLVEARLEDADGEPTANVEHGEEIRLRLELEIKRDLPGLDVGFLVANADGLGVFNFGIPVGEREGTRELAAGQRVRRHRRPSTTSSSPAATSSTAASTAPTRAASRCTCRTRSTSSSSAARRPAGSSTRS